MAITERLLQAAETVMVTEGYTALSVDGLAHQAGTTRPTFYRRFPNVAHLALEVIKCRFGVGSPVDTGSLYEDLLTLQRDDIEMFSSPLLSNNLPGLLEAARVDSSLGDLFGSYFIGPRRANVARVVNAAIKREEISMSDGDVDIDFVCDLLVGPVLARALLPVNVSMDDDFAKQTVRSAISRLTLN